MGAQIPGARSPHKITVALAIGETPVRRFLPVSLLELRSFRWILDFLYTFVHPLFISEANKNSFKLSQTP